MKLLLTRRLAIRIALALLLTALAIEAALRLTPLPVELHAGAPVSTEFLDRHGKPLRTLLVDERRYARRCTLADISPALPAATISAEDKRFYRHSGADFAATARAAIQRARRGGGKRGASTITQQLVKLARPGPRSWTRKVEEVWLALSIEKKWGKQQIIEEYLNRLDYGNLQIGIASASRFYFGKPAADLSTAEAALLAALPNAPARLNPHANLSAARARQQWVLHRMLRNGAIDAAEQARAASEPLALLPPQREFAAPHFVDLLLKRRGLLPDGGGELRTTLDLDLTRFAERTLAQQLALIADKNASNGAVVVIDNRTSELLALAGSGDYFQPGSGQLNGAWMIRSPGSAVKPFTYLLALERGANPGDIVPDVPSEFATPTGLYRPNNYNHRFYGPVSLRFALGNSLNVGAVRTLERAGGPDALHRALRAAGITTLGHPAEHYGLGLTLGNGEVRLLELVNAYAALASLGVHRPCRLVLRENGAALPPGRRIFDARAAYLLADILADNTARSATFGLSSWLAFDFPVACKTGTSSDYRDNWAVGYTPEFSVGVWVGNPDGSRMQGITGVTGAAPVMHEMFVHLRQRFGTSWFAAPEGIRTHTIHPLTGRSVPANHPAAVNEKCLWPPQPERAGDFDAGGRVALPAEYSAWLAGSQNSLGDLVVSAGHANELRILQPPPGATYYLDPDLPATSQRIALRAEAQGAVEWSSDSLRCETRERTGAAQLREGRHIISARDTATGRVASTWIEVRPL